MVIKNMKTRIGKIARLPKVLRDELNRRLDEGEFGNELLAWLNGLPEVQRILAAHFGGQPISKHNLSAWRHGGFADWVRSHESREVRQMADEAAALSRKGTAKDGTTAGDFLAMFVLVELAEAIERLHEIKDSEKRWKLLRGLSRELSKLRMDDCRGRTLRLKHLITNHNLKSVPANEAE
jgi:hypothetical protein